MIIDRCSIDVRYSFKGSRRVRGGSEEHWRSTGGALEEDCTRVGGLEEDRSSFEGLLEKDWRRMCP